MMYLNVVMVNINKMTHVSIALLSAKPVQMVATVLSVSVVSN